MHPTVLKTTLKQALLVTVSLCASASIAGDLYYLGSPSLDTKIEKPGFKTTLGYQLNPSFAIEGGYADTTSTGMKLAGLGFIPVSEQLSFFGKVGYTLNGIRPNASWTGIALNNTPEKSAMGMALGGIYQINPTLGFRAQFEKLDSEINLISFGLQAKF
jgi:hypothetical protein